MPANKSTDKDKQRGTTRAKPVDIARGPVDIARGVSIRPQASSHIDTSGFVDTLACDIVRARCSTLWPVNRVIGGVRTVELYGRFACRTEAAAALVMRRFEQFLSELDGYKLPE